MDSNVKENALMALSVAMYREIITEETALNIYRAIDDMATGDFSEFIAPIAEIMGGLADKLAQEGRQ